MNSITNNIRRLAALWAIGSGAALAAGSATTLVTMMPHLILGNDNSLNPSLAIGGKAIAFESDAFNFLPQDGNNTRDIYLAIGKKISRINVNSLGNEAQNCQEYWAATDNLTDSLNPAISPSGKFVVFESLADNLDLLTKDTDNNAVDPFGSSCGAINSNDKESDIFFRDVAKKKTYRISGIMDGGDGSLTLGTTDVTGAPLKPEDRPWKIMAEANDVSSNPSISANDKTTVVAFQSKATNLLSQNNDSGKNIANIGGGKWQIYVVDLATKKLELISAVHDADPSHRIDTNNPHSFAPTAAGSDDSVSPSISPDGRFVSFHSKSTNLVGVTPNPTTARHDIFIYDRNNGKMAQLSGAMALSGSGYSVHTEGNGDSINSNIASGAVKSSKTGATSIMVTFQSKASNLDDNSAPAGITPIPSGDANSDDDIFVAEFAIKDAAATTPLTAEYEIKSLTRISGAHDSSGAISGEAYKRASNTSALQTANSTLPAIYGTKDAYVVTFRSDADNMYPAETYFWNQDTNKVSDVYVWDSKQKLLSRANVDAFGIQGSASAGSSGPTISPDGKVIGFETSDNYLAPYMLGNLKSQIYTRKYLPAKLTNPNLF